MHIDLTGRTALVSGSTAGIGHAVALGLAASGAGIVVNGRTAARVEAAVSAIAEATGAPVRGAAADVATAAGCRALVEAVPDVDILVNNAGFAEIAPMFEVDDESWQRHFDTNVMSGVRLTRHYAPRMVQRGWGRVIFVSSEAGVRIDPDMAQYGMTKAAQIAVARGAAAAVAGSAVTVNTVLPGPTVSEATEPLLAARLRSGSRSRAEAGDRLIAETRPTSLLRRMASAEEVANLVVYLASEQASYTTGTAVRVDGGIVPTTL